MERWAMLTKTIAKIIYVGLVSLLACNVQGGELAKHVSIYKLIVEPEKYDGQLVMVSGYIGGRNGPSRGLFVRKIDALITNTVNKINFDRSSASEAVFEKCPWSYVTVVGNFSVSPAAGKLTLRNIRSVSSFDISNEEQGVKRLPCYHE
ncbi:hypothetical protein [Microbulbifer sp. A4B17]|uniref:hypothetical protein n=1 Tax=Microbulbifer sp. A4B17 TaxID=359370 RepID=UPI0013009D65|nr:hypothetical protein [Microbulbifer sp. A4B17]